MKKLTDGEKEMTWGEDAPYSEAKIVINTRVLGEQVSRVMVEVEVNINPTTFKIIKNNREEFVGDVMMEQLLDTARYMGKGYGYQASAGCEQYTNEGVMKDAQIRLEYAKECLIRMHKFVIDNYEF